METYGEVLDATAHHVREETWVSISAAFLLITTCLWSVCELEADLGWVGFRLKGLGLMLFGILNCETMIN